MRWSRHEIRAVDIDDSDGQGLNAMRFKRLCGALRESQSSEPLDCEMSLRSQRHLQLGVCSVTVSSASLASWLAFR